jgi:hypothetical protein
MNTEQNTADYLAAFRSADQSQVPAEDLPERVRSLVSALRDARLYVEAYVPKDISEAHDRDLMLDSIGQLIGERS